MEDVGLYGNERVNVSFKYI